MQRGKQETRQCWDWATRSPPYHCPWELGSTSVPPELLTHGVGTRVKELWLQAPVFWGGSKTDKPDIYLQLKNFFNIPWKAIYTYLTIHWNYLFLSCHFFSFIYTLQFLLILLWSRPFSIKFSVKDFLKYLQEIITIYHQWKVTVSFQVKLSNYQKPYRVENNSKTKICFPNQLNFFSKNCIPFVFLEFIVAIFTQLISTY